MRHAMAIGLVVFAVTVVPVDAALASDPPPTRSPLAVSPTPGAQIERDDLPGPQLELVTHAAQIATPPVPSFELPATEPGFRSPRELRVRGKPLLGADVKVRGYVTWAYDCVEALAIANPSASREQIQTAIHGDPTLCERTAFSLGDAPDASRDASISVVSPAPGARGRGAPQSAAGPALPTLAAGDYVVVTGRWSAPAAPTGNASDGVLVWSIVDRAVPTATSASEPVAPLQGMEIVLDGPARVPMRKVVDEQTLNASIEHMNACNKATVARQYDLAIAECQGATTTWDGNHLAWYAWAGVHMARREWLKAIAAIEHAVRLRPDQAMYQLYHGIALYEAAQDEARKHEPSAAKLAAARDALAAAVKLTPELWRAHYYLGRAYRDLGDTRRAAVQFTATIRTNPAYRFAYIALIEIYRRWDYVDQALAVATLGAAGVPAGDAAELWFEVGIIHDARHADDKAIEAFSNAIAARPDDAGSRFERAQIYLRKGDVASARRDLEDVARSTDPRAGAMKQLAAQLLASLAATKAGGTPPRIPSWECTRQSLSNMVECRRR